MPWTNRFSKDDCKTAKDVNWGKIASIAKVDVPAMVLSAFTKKIAKEASYNIAVDIDDAAQKGRVVLKFPSGKKDEIIEFSTVDAETAKKVRTAKKAIDEDFKTTKLASTKLATVKGDYKKYKAELAGYAKVVSAGKVKFMERSTLNRKIFALEKSIEKSLKLATGIEKEHDSWYVKGPRAGKSKYIKDAAIEEKKLAAEDQKYFDQILFKLTAECGNVKKIYKQDVFPALETLGHKAAAVRTMLTKSEKQAIKEVERHLIEELNIFKKTNQRAVVDLKAEKSENFVKDINKKGDAQDRLMQQMGDMHFWKSYWDSNQGRLARIPDLLKAIEKNAKRMKKIVPSGMEKSGNIPKLLSNIDLISGKLADAMKRDKVLLEKEKTELTKYKP